MFQVVLNPTVLPFTSTQSEREDRTYSQRIHIDDENKMLHSTRLDPHLRVASSITYDPISMINHINVIDLDVTKGLRKNMIVNDMNICIVILGRLNVRGVGKSLRGWMR